MLVRRVEHTAAEERVKISASGATAATHQAAQRPSAAPITIAGPGALIQHIKAAIQANTF